ncbi:TauD/TfdA family dioxygenase [Thiobacter aerophilum]|uniref:TauD/TfdA family dioxygenase n=1 Tax=Thiobacter aerophilum TaxID=3121275 RepID=A0ABV0EG42_9BURK
MAGPFDLGDETAYRAWRDAKLAAYPRSVDELVVTVGDPRQLTAAEHAAILDRCRRANMAIYVSGHLEADKALPRRLGQQFGLARLDRNLLADEDAISTLTVAEEQDGMRGEYIPYTNRPIRWHTDGYYNPPENRICGMILHCVQAAERGGENRLLDHEVVYILLRDRDPEYVRVLSEPDVMTIPARMDESGVARPAQTGPVFSVLPDSGALHMRYTARTRSIQWREGAAVRAAVAALESILAEDSPFVLTARLEPGMGLICNNVLHDRSGFDDSPARRRVIYRGRYLDRIRGTEMQPQA